MRGFFGFARAAIPHAVHVRMSSGRLPSRYSIRPVTLRSLRNRLTAGGVSPTGSVETAMTCILLACAPSWVWAAWRLETMSGHTSGQWL